MVNTILAKRINHIVAKGDNPVWPKGSKSHGFSNPIKVLDNMFADADAWGTDSLKGWVEDYESTRFTQINGHTAVITSEYNMPCVKEWLTRCTAIADIKEF